MTKLPVFRRWTRAAALLLVAACGGGDGSTDPQPQPGFLTVSLATPAADDGAIVLSVSGPGAMSQFASVAPATQLFARRNGTSQRVLLVGDLNAGQLVRFHVPDVSAAAAYRATIVEVASRGNEVRASTASYSLTVAR